MIRPNAGAVNFYLLLGLYLGMIFLRVNSVLDFKRFHPTLVRAGSHPSGAPEHCKTLGLRYTPPSFHRRLQTLSDTYSLNLDPRPLLCPCFPPLLLITLCQPRPPSTSPISASSRTRLTSSGLPNPSPASRPLRGAKV